MLFTKKCEICWKNKVRELNLKSYVAYIENIYFLMTQTYKTAQELVVPISLNMQVLVCK